MALFNVFDSLIDIIGELLPNTNAQLPLQILRDLDLVGENVSQSLYLFFDLESTFVLSFVFGIFPGPRDLLLLIGRSIRLFVVLVLPEKVLEARSPRYLMMAIESRPSEARRLLLEQKE